MPPKGRKSVSPWNQCEVCNVLISQKDLALHLEYSCPPSADSWIHGYIKDTVLFGVLEDTVREDAFNKIPKHEQDNLVLLSKSALQLCDIAIGDPVIVTLCGVSTIKRAWPTVDRSLVSVLMCKKAIEVHWKSAKNHHVKVRRLTMVPLPAEEVLIDTGEKSQFTSEFITILHAKYQGRILGIGDRLHMQHYGKDVILTVQQIIPFQVHRDKITLFSKSLERISLEETAEGKNEFFKVEGETRWKIIANEQPEMETSAHTKLANIGGLQNIILEVYEIMQLALGNVLITEGMQVIRGILLFGVSGIGKTLLAEALAAESKAFLITVRGAEIYSKYLGETETKLRQLFQKAKDRAPSVLLLDEVDALCPKRDQDSSGGSEQERRVISTLLTLMDELHSKKGSPAAVFVLATTSKPDAIDPSLRRPGRFDREIEVPVPTPEARLDILKKLLANTTHVLTDKQLQGMAHAAHGFVGADLASLCSLAANQALKRTSSSFSRVTIKSEDFSWALKQVKPSAMREVLIEITDVKWSDIGGQHDLKLKLQQAVEWPLKHPEAFTRLGISPPRGVLLYGPPGCSKTMIAKALATESKLNFISIKGPELFSKWVGESERAVREIFRRARQVAPAIVFFDELDALGGERSSKSGSGGISVQERVLAQLLTELDGVEPLGNVTVVGATNRPDRIDKALLRPGRLDRVLYVPLPNTQARKEILEIQLRKMPISADVNIEELVEKTEDYSGAEVLAVCHEAALSALEEDITIATVCHCHFLKGLELIKPRTPISLLKLYDEYQKIN